MSFEGILQNLVDGTPHGVGAILVDWEGEAVQEYCHCDPYDIRFVAAHKAIILGLFKDIHDDGRGGEMEDVVVTASAAHLLIGVVDSDYALVLHVGRDCPVAVALRHFRGAVGLLKKEI